MNSWTIKSGVGAVTIIVLSGVSAIVLPFATYATTLATFGIAHVFIELRYLDSRFHQRFSADPLSHTLESRLLQLLSLIALARFAALFGFLPPSLAHLLELLCGLGLVGFATAHLGQKNWRLGTIGLIVSVLLGLGILWDPITTSVCLAILHNLTPIGFVLERQRSLRTGLACAGVLGLLPIVIFCGHYFSGPALTVTGLSSDALEMQKVYLSAFLAPTWQQWPISQALFAAVTFLQCMHYAIVIGVFSRWTDRHTKTFLPWLPHRYFYGYLGIVAIGLLFAFQHSFVLTRAVYGIIAAVHAWLEIPLLLLLLQLINQQPPDIGRKISPQG